MNDVSCFVIFLSIIHVSIEPEIQTYLFETTLTLLEKGQTFFNLVTPLMEMTEVKAVTPVMSEITARPPVTEVTPITPVQIEIEPNFKEEKSNQEQKKNAENQAKIEYILLKAFIFGIITASIFLATFEIDKTWFTSELPWTHEIYGIIKDIIIGSYNLITTLPIIISNLINSFIMNVPIIIEQIKFVLENICNFIIANFRSFQNGFGFQTEEIIIKNDDGFDYNEWAAILGIPGREDYRG